MKRKISTAESDALRRLIEAFLEGSTTIAQEEQIYAEFSTYKSGTLPDDIEQYRPMFGWYGSLKTKKTQSHKKRFSIINICAAALLVLIIAGGMFLAPKFSISDEQRQLRARYDGSYIIRNGKRITDLDAIMLTLMRAEEIADSVETAAIRQINTTDINYERQILEQSISGISDTTLARQLREDLLNNKKLSKK